MLVAPVCWQLYVSQSSCLTLVSLDGPVVSCQRVTALCTMRAVASFSAQCDLLVCTVVHTPYPVQVAPCAGVSTLCFCVSDIMCGLGEHSAYRYICCEWPPPLRLRKDA